MSEDIRQSLIQPISKNYKVPIGFLVNVMRLDKSFNDDYYTNLRLNEIAAKFKLKNVRRGNNLYKANDDGNECYIIYRGKISIVREDGVDLGTYEKGSFIGYHHHHHHPSHISLSSSLSS